MEFHHRRLLLLNKDDPITTTTFPLPPPSPPPSSMFLRPSSWQLPPRPIYTSNLAYTFLFLFTAVFFLGFILLYIRHFSHDSDSDSVSPRRRNTSSSGGFSAVKPLPELPYRGESKPQQAECAICLDEFREGITVKMIPHCKHVFHPECIDAWLVEHVTCPVCRCEKIVCESGRSEQRGEEVVVEGGIESEGAVGESTRVRGNTSSRFGLRRSMSF